MENVLQKLKSNIGEYRAEEMKYKIEIIRGCMNSITVPFMFARPFPITLPSKCSISSIQENIQRTRMGHGRSLKKKTTMEKDSTSLSKQVRPTLRPLPHKLVSTLKWKKTIFPKIPKVLCDACFTKIMIERGDTIVYCRNCDRQLKST